MPTTKAKIERLARALFPRSGIKDVGSLLHRQLEHASLSVMSEDEVEAAGRGDDRRRSPSLAPAPPPTPAAKIERDVEAILSTPTPDPSVVNLGMARAERLAEGLRAMGHEALAFRQYGIWNSVGVHRVGRGTAGDWRHVITFFDDGRLQHPAGGPAYGTGNPWRHGGFVHLLDGRTRILTTLHLSGVADGINGEP